MTAINQIQSILCRWPSRRAVHEDALAADPSLDMIAVHRWFQRGSIPPKYDTALLVGADRRGIELHPMDIMRARSGHIDQIGHAEISRQPNALNYDQKDKGGAA